MSIATIAWAAAWAVQAATTVPAVRASGNIGEFIQAEDYPPAAWVAREEGPVRFAVDIAPDGRVTNCSILGSSGSRALDEGTCQIVTSHAHFTPARDAQGRATSDRLTATINWQLPDELPADPILAFVDYLSSADYPPEALQRGEQGEVEFVIIVSADGRPTDCRITLSSGSRLLDEATCRALIQRARFAPARDERRRPERSGVISSVVWRIEANGVGSVAAPLAPQLRARSHTNLAAYVTNNDYPIEALRRNEQGRVGFVLHVSAEGRVSDCAVTVSSGSALLDARTCQIMRNRARFQAARDAQGNPAPDRVTASMSWRIWN